MFFSIVLVCHGLLSVDAVGGAYYLCFVGLIVSGGAGVVCW